MAYTYSTQFPQASRARIEAVKIQAGLQLDDSKEHLRSLADLEFNVRRYILLIFDAFATEALALGRRGIWSLERVDREATEFLSSVTLEAQFRKGHDLQGRAISPLVDRVFSRILPEVRRDFEHSSEWRHYQTGLLTVANIQASLDTADPSMRNGQDVANTEDQPTAAAPCDGESAGGPGVRKISSSRAQSWEHVEIAFLSDQRTEVLAVFFDKKGTTQLPHGRACVLQAWRAFPAHCRPSKN